MVYIGQTGRQLNQCLCEHKRAVKTADFNSSALAEHAWSAGHAVDLEIGERYALLMRANKPETAVQSSKPFSPGTTWMCIILHILHFSLIIRLSLLCLDDIFLLTFSCAHLQALWRGVSLSLPLTLGLQSASVTRYLTTSRRPYLQH